MKCNSHFPPSSALFRAPAGELEDLRWQVAKERSEAADWIMRILQDYKMVSAVVMADYLKESLSRERADGAPELETIKDGRRVFRGEQGETKDFFDLVAENAVRETDLDRAEKAREARWRHAARQARRKPESGTFDAIAEEQAIRHHRHQSRQAFAEDGQTTTALPPVPAAGSPMRSRAGSPARSRTRTPATTLSRASPSRRRARRRGEGVGEGELPTPSPVVEPPGFRMSMTDMEAALDREIDLREARQSVHLMLDLLHQQAKEPTNGRYSHLIGRWMTW